MAMNVEIAAADREQLERLARMKRVALGALVACFLVFLLARWMSESVPAMRLVAAFAEAAMIGGLADWYAVVVLFRRPLGLPIPHTAIIPANQDRIGDNLGAFLERNFLSDRIVRDKLGSIDFAAHLASHLSDRNHSRELAVFATGLVPDVLRAIDDSGFRDFAARRIARLLSRTPVAPVAAGLIDELTRDERFQGILDDILAALERVLSDKRTLETIERRVAQELPTLLYVFQTEGLILKRIVRTVALILEEVRNDPDHALRAEFTELFRGYVERMKASQRFERRIEQFKTDLFASPELASLADRLWEHLGEYVERDARSPEPALAGQLTGLLLGLARSLERDERLRGAINEGLRGLLARLVADQKAQVSRFVADEVKSWDFRQLVMLIEANVGRDLQFIRFNGMIVGGLAGVGLYLLEVSLLPF